jgi:phosphoglycerol transferase MdoB-like AlkP superfamily enzyme
MSEAFSDLDILGEFTTNEDYIPFVHSLLKGADNTQSGYLHVSVLGGNTANTEFEFLTGETMAFLPQGSIPYQQYVKMPTFSLASYLNELGYSTVAMHPYLSTGWQRDKAYTLLDFHSFLAIDSFDSPTYIRKYVSDESDFDKIREIYENKEAGQPLFLFNVTMQNHSSYQDSFDNFQPGITVEGSDDAALSNYLSLLKISDDELEKLVDYFSRQEEKTLLVFFGDHQPSDQVVEDIWRLNGKDPANLELADLQLRYEVPFFIWANYDIEEKTGVDTSPNFLSCAVLEAAGLPYSDYHLFLQELSESYPVISSIQVKDAAGNSYEVKECMEDLQKYSLLQYYQLFDRTK